MNTSELADAVTHFGKATQSINVTIRNEIVNLLSDQLYQSPLKAIEELVVNAYDADATICRVYVPEPSKQDNQFIVVFDNGIGMDVQGLTDLWQIARSKKRENEALTQRRQRKQIGKFGIGKLATRTIANQLTYLTRAENVIRSVTLNFEEFSKAQSQITESDTNTEQKPVKLTIREISWHDLINQASFTQMCQSIDIEINELERFESWTFVILENLKPKAKEIKRGRLQWVLRTAMPLQSDFKLFLEADEIVSSKVDIPILFEFKLSGLPINRIEEIIEATGESWEVIDEGLYSSSFPSGVFGRTIVTEDSLYMTKSDDISRSNGFFIRTLKRLINLDDPLFGLIPLSYAVFNRFRADISADDLDQVIKAPRESVETADITSKFQKLLMVVFREAQQQYNHFERDREDKEKRRPERERNYVDPKLVEYATADAVARQSKNPAAGSEADDSWFYLDFGNQVNKDVALELYRKAKDRKQYRYSYAGLGKTQRLVRFNPLDATFTINEDHEFAINFLDNGSVNYYLLEDFATAEALLEIYLFESGVSAHLIGEILEKRDALLKSLAKDHPLSLKAVARTLRDSATDERELEMAVIIAMRALGFVAQHISNAGEPDGLARLTQYGNSEVKVTIEAKASNATPTLQQIDIGGIHRHKLNYQADGAILVAPSFPGSTRGIGSSLSESAVEYKISCWKVDVLARFVELAEARHLTAKDLLEIVMTKFAPEDVENSLTERLTTPTWQHNSLYYAILEALRTLEENLQVTNPRTVDMILAVISALPEFRKIEQTEIKKAVSALASASQGSLVLNGDNLTLLTSVDEFERRVQNLIGRVGTPRRNSSFRDDDKKHL